MPIVATPASSPSRSPSSSVRCSTRPEDHGYTPRPGPTPTCPRSWRTGRTWRHRGLAHLPYHRGAVRLPCLFPLEHGTRVRPECRRLLAPQKGGTGPDEARGARTEARATGSPT